MKLTCLTNKWTYDGEPWHAPVEVYWPNYGNALPLPNNTHNVHFSYVDFWSAKTTWGGEDPPGLGDSIVITRGQYIVLDVSPPRLHLVLIYGGHLEFLDSLSVGDIELNCSYIMAKNYDGRYFGGDQNYAGHLSIGSEEKPFGVETNNHAVITLEGDRKSLEIPVYGGE